jgi:hypothetical protein
MLRLIDRATGRPVLTRSERAEQERQRAHEARLRARIEKLRADALAAEVARLRTLLGQQDPAHD